MTQATQLSAAEATVDPGKATDTLSQFTARVLNQLSLSAWLPAAALVMLVTFVVQLGEALSHPAAGPNPRSPAIQAIQSIAGISLGGALLLIGAVVVLTIVTQAFSFEAIRILEGYWGTNRYVERVAQWRCLRHRAVRMRLDRRMKSLTLKAWYGGALLSLRRQTRRGAGTTWNVLEAFGYSLMEKRSPVTLTDAEKKIAR